MRDVVRSTSTGHFGRIGTFPVSTYCPLDLQQTGPGFETCCPRLLLSMEASRLRPSHASSRIGSATSAPNRSVLVTADWGRLGLSRAHHLRFETLASNCGPSPPDTMLVPS